MKFKSQEISVINNAIKLQERMKAEVEFKDMADINLKDNEQFIEPITEIINKYAKEVE